MIAWSWEFTPVVALAAWFHPALPRLGSRLAIGPLALGDAAAHRFLSRSPDEGVRRSRLHVRRSVLSLATQCQHWICSCGSARWYVHRQQSHYYQQRGDGDEGGWIAGFHP